MSEVKKGVITYESSEDGEIFLVRKNPKKVKSASSNVLKQCKPNRLSRSKHENDNSSEK